MPSRYSPEQEAAFRAAYFDPANRNCGDVAKVLGKSRKTIQNLARARGWPPKASPGGWLLNGKPLRVHWTQAEKDLLRVLWTKPGTKVQDIAKQISKTYFDCIRQGHKMGLPLRKGGALPGHLPANFKLLQEANAKARQGKGRGQSPKVPKPGIPPGQCPIIIGQMRNRYDADGKKLPAKPVYCCCPVAEGKLFCQEHLPMPRSK